MKRSLQFLDIALALLLVVAAVLISSAWAPDRSGNSLGGGVAWKTAVDHPQRVDRLVLVDGAGYDPARTVAVVKEGLATGR